MKKLIFIALLLFGCSKPDDTAMLRFQFAYPLDNCQSDAHSVIVATDRGLLTFDAYEVSGGVQTAFKTIEKGPYTITSIEVLNKDGEVTHIVRDDYTDPLSVMVVPFNINLTENQVIGGGVFCE